VRDRVGVVDVDRDVENGHTHAGIQEGVFTTLVVCRLFRIVVRVAATNEEDDLSGGQESDRGKYRRCHP